MSNHAKTNFLEAFFLVGPTCSGKTAVAQWLAERQGFDVLSADSMSVYKGMSVGTAKPDALEMSRVHYWGVDLVEPSEVFNVDVYRKYAIAALESVVSNSRKMIVAGGTGLYIRSLIDGLVVRAPPNTGVRSRAEQMMQDEGVESLRVWLRAESEELYESLSDKNNPRRLIRAIEQAVQGVRSSDRSWRNASSGPCIPGLRLPPEQLYARIERRAREMFANGLIEEVEVLLAKGFETASTARHAIGYAEAVDCLNGRCSVDEAVARTIVRTRQLAKRQLTWFRTQANVAWVCCDESMPVVEISAKIMEHWETHGPTKLSS